MNELVDFLREHQVEIGEQTLEHLQLTLTALAFAVILGVSTGVLISTYKRLARPVVGFVNAIQTIPSLALLGFMIPLIGIGSFPAIVALFLYALLPIVRNTYTGIMQVDASVTEAALGMGLRGVILKLAVIPVWTMCLTMVEHGWCGLMPGVLGRMEMAE